MAKQAGGQVSEADLERAIMQFAQDQGIALESREEKEQLKQEFILQQMRYQIVSSHNMDITPDELESQIKNLPPELQKAPPTQYHIENLLIPANKRASQVERQSMLWSYFYTIWCRVLNKTDQLLPAQNPKVIAEKALLSAKRGASFSQLVAECRSTPRWTVNDLGWRTAAQIPSFYLQAIQSLKLGEVAGPFEAPNGWHVIRLLEKRGDATQDLTHLRQILLVNYTDKDEAAVKNKLNTIRTQCLKKGGRFEAQAKQYSEDPASAFKGGDLGWVLPATLGDVFDAQMTQLIPGQISKPFQTDRGWHIIQVLERQPLTPTHPKWKEHMARKLIAQRKMIEAIENWRKELYARAYIQRIEPSIQIAETP